MTQGYVRAGNLFVETDECDRTRRVHSVSYLARAKQQADSGNALTLWFLRRGPNSYGKIPPFRFVIEAIVHDRSIFLYLVASLHSLHHRLSTMAIYSYLYIYLFIKYNSYLYNKYTVHITMSAT